MRQRKAFFGIHWVLRQAEQRADGQTKSFTRFGGQTTANDQGNAATGAHFVKQDVALDGEFGNDFAGFEGFAVIRTQFNHVAHVHGAHVQLDRQSARVFHGVVENGGNFAAQTHAAETLVRDKRDVLTREPQHRVGGRFT